MRKLFSTYKKKPLFGFILILFIILNSEAYAQKSKQPQPIKTDSILKKKKKKEKRVSYNGHDGPFIINDTLLYRVSSDDKLIQYVNFKKDSVKVYVDNKDEDEFYVSIDSDYDNPKSEYDLPEKMIVISDIEGNFNAFSSFLYSNEVIDKHFNWIYGDGHLVLNGDFVDRGEYVTQVLWLIYKLEQQAKVQDGMVHFILGNHEILNFHGDHRYNLGKTIKVATDISQLEK